MTQTHTVVIPATATRKPRMLKVETIGLTNVEAIAVAKLNPKLAGDKKAKPVKAEARHVSSETVALGQQLSIALDGIAAATEEAHATAFAIRKALCPTGIVKQGNKFLPEVLTFLAAVFEGSTKSPGALKTAKTRLMTVIVTTTAHGLGSDRKPKDETNGRKPRPGSNDAGEEGDEDSSPSKTKATKGSILGHIKAMEKLLNQIKRALPDDALDLAGTMQDHIDMVRELAC